MPIHEYKCTDCGEINELLVGIGRNSDELTCRNCGSDRLEKMMSAAAINMSGAAEAGPVGSTCCGSDPSVQGCVPGSCCGAVR